MGLSQSIEQEEGQDLDLDLELELEAVIIQILILILTIYISPEIAISPKKKECVICLTNSPDYIITACGHKCLCQDCGIILNKCPICRKDFDPTTQFIQVFES